MYHRFLLMALVAISFAGRSEADDRTSYPNWLSDSYIAFRVGAIQYPFSAAQLEEGHWAQSVHRPPMAVHLTLYGHHINRHLSAQITYLRPVLWVRYAGLDGTSAEGTVWANIAGATLRRTLPLTSRSSLYAEGGLGIVTRHGFEAEGRPIVRSANYPTMLLGAGMSYHLNRKWDIEFSGAYVPPRPSIQQPYTLMVSAGGVLKTRSRDEQVAASALPKVTALFPKHLIQFSQASNELGTGVNRLVSSKVPIFWGGSVDISRGAALRYQRNVFHTASVFSLDWGVSVSNWWTKRDGQNIWTIALYPQFRFTPIRTHHADGYLSYAVAGPAYITQSTLDGKNTGKRFTFQDLMSVGAYVGDQRHLNVEAGIGHYSNGSLFPHNPGVKIPLTISVGYAF